MSTQYEAQVPKPQLAQKLSEKKLNFFMNDESERDSALELKKELAMLWSNKS